MISISAKLAELLGTVRHPGDFYASGRVALSIPRLEVDGVGPVALPLLPVQAEQLIAVATRAPYGRGEATLIDPAVRRTWQIGADRVRVGGKHWERTLQAILERATESLGATCEVRAELYKLLIYDEGSFFVSHRDTEKVPGMFATLVIVVPSVSMGGDLVVRHKGRQVTVDLRCEDPSEAAFAAFYADCVHEVLPVTAGYRLALVYNLVRPGKGPLPEPPDYDGERSAAAALLQAWSAGKRSPDDDSPEKLIYVLEHAYTPAELGFGTLKGPDRAAAEVLVPAAAQSGCDLHLALLSVEENGPAEYVGSSRRRWSDTGADDWELVEIDDKSMTVSEWRRPDGSPSALGELPFEEGELVPPDAFDDMDPDEEHFHEATGNEGASIERSYRRAGFVLWPHDRFLAVLNQAGLPVTLSFLGDLTERWAAAAAGEDVRSFLWMQAHELSGRMIADRPARDGNWHVDDAPGDASRMLTLLVRLGDTARIEAFLADIAAGSRRGSGDNSAILAALGALPPGRAVAAIDAIIAAAAAAATSLAMCADLLARVVPALPDVRSADLVGAATALVDALPGDPSRAGPEVPWRRDRSVVARFIIDLFTGLVSISKPLAERAADHVLAWSKVYDLDGIVVPAVRGLTGSTLTNSSAAVQRLRLACLNHLRARIAEPLEAPRDWRRASALSCTCRHCGELAVFLADPSAKTWFFRAAEFDRRHVEMTINRAGCDVGMTTERRGRPYSLVCTKNQASYERLSNQRTKDLADCKWLEL
jgi:predicted 2-oxoglutarate/Fe(II)-dependent dioxygenase YbiX